MCLFENDNYKSLFVFYVFKHYLCKNVKNKTIIEKTN